MIQAPVEVEDNLNDQTASNDSDFTFVDGASAFDTGASSHHQQIDDLSSVELPAVKTGTFSVNPPPLERHNIHADLESAAPELATKCPQ